MGQLESASMNFKHNNTTLNMYTTRLLEHVIGKTYNRGRYVHTCRPCSMNYFRNGKASFSVERLSSLIVFYGYYELDEETASIRGKVMIDKSRSEVSLMEQDTIDNVS